MNNERLEKYETPSTPKAKPSALQPLFFAGTLIVGMFIGTNLGDQNLLKVKTGTEQNPNKLVSLIDYIEDHYVDSVDKKKLIDDAIGSILKNLDPHSSYMAPDVLAESKEQLEGKFEGIGVEFMIHHDSLVVVKTVPGGPSEEAGLRSGDRIVQVEGQDISGKELTNDKAQKLLKGKGGSEVKVAVWRRGEKESMPFTIVRGSIPIESVSASFMVDDTTGYIKVERFAQTTYEEFYEATKALEQQGCKKLLLDLRGNGGGLLDQATAMVEEFLPPDRLIVYTEGRHSSKEVIKSSKRGEFVDMDVVVMIDQSSASASEIVAGALQDWDRSVTVGRRSFGKGLVQHEVELPDKSALRLTVARYYTPTGRCIQKPYGDSVNYNDDFHQRLVNGELTVADSTHFSDSLKYKTPGGRTVYGGGGIMPDVFVPLDSTYLNGILGELSYSGIIRQYSFEYVDLRRKEFAKFKNSEEFVNKFVVSDAMLSELFALAKKEGIEVNSANQRKLNLELKNRVKAQIARNLFDDNAMYQVLLTNDKDFKQAMSVAGQYRKFAVNVKQ
ncbi:MAG: S41 family peptidase [Flavobacteriales bacterium]